MLDRVDVDMIEASDPSASPNVAKMIECIPSLGLRAGIVAHNIASSPSIYHAKACGVYVPCGKLLSRRLLPKITTT